MLYTFLLSQEEAEFVAEFLAVGGIDCLINLETSVDDQQNQVSILKGNICLILDKNIDLKTHIVLIILIL